MVGLLLCMFEVPQRQQLASERTSLTLFAPAPSLAPSTALGTGNSPPLGGEQI